jgi:serine phosphatase RsbU (regulator of sigma subunit)
MAPDPSPRHRLAPAPVQLNPLRTLPGRLFLLSGVSLAVLLLVQQFMVLPGPVEAFRKVVSLGTIVSVLWIAALYVVAYRGEFLWRVRRKLILSYVFLGFVPVVLIALFVLAVGFILHANIAGYLFREGVNDIVADVHLVATTSATEIGEFTAASGDGSIGEAARVAAVAVLNRKFALLGSEYRGLSLALVPVEEFQGIAATRGVLAKAGEWRHMPPPDVAPVWVGRRGFRGLLTMVPEGLSAEDSDVERLLIRSAAPLANGRYVVVVDLPVDTDISSRIDLETNVRMISVGIRVAADDDAQPVTGKLLANADAVEATDGERDYRGMFQRTVVATEFTDWRNGKPGEVRIGLDAPLSKVYRRLSPNSEEENQIVLLMALLASLLMIVQGVALFFGVGLGRQITSAIHELFVGTERVQQGDFTYRIKNESRDQLGALGDQFNLMSAGMEHLLHVQREKQRLDDELRIAHEIQTSLLPDRPPTYAGLTIADLCVPAREVGGDYYDFFELGPRQLGVLVADVSGKGTSAALYMAELKGLMLALSHEERSPKKLLTRVNHLLADHLDNRSFITMTYGVIDLDARTLTHARAGHTPLIVVSRRCKEDVEVIIPNGMVLGLRLPGAADRFESLLEEHTMPIDPGDVIVFYTDGITEAMNVAGDLFSDESLARVVCSHRTLDATGIRERVLRDVHAFVGEAEPHDDMTMVIVKVEEHL